MSKILTWKEATDKDLYCAMWAHNDYMYRDENGIEHLIRDGKEIVKGHSVVSYADGYEYVDERGIYHLIEGDGKEIATYLSTKAYYKNDYICKCGSTQKLVRNDKVIVKSWKVFSSSNGDYGYQNVDRNIIRFNKKEEIETEVSNG